MTATWSSRSATAAAASALSASVNEKQHAPSLVSLSSSKQNSSDSTNNQTDTHTVTSLPSASQQAQQRSVPPTPVLYHNQIAYSPLRVTPHDCAPRLRVLPLAPNNSSATASALTLQQQQQVPHQTALPVGSLPSLYNFKCCQLLVGDKGYRSIRCTHAIVYGSLYYEVKILAQPVPVRVAGYATVPHCRVGIAGAEFDITTSVGADKYSYGFRDLTGQAVHDGMLKPTMPEDEEDALELVDAASSTTTTVDEQQQVQQQQQQSEQFKSLMPFLKPGDIVGVLVDLPRDETEHNEALQQQQQRAQQEEQRQKDAQAAKDAAEQVSTGGGGRRKGKNKKQKRDLMAIRPTELHSQHDAAAEAQAQAAALATQRAHALATDPHSALLHLHPHSVYHPNSRLSLFVNGKRNPVEFTNLYRQAYYPCVSLYMGAAVQVNFGPDFECVPQELLDRAGVKQWPASALETEIAFADHRSAAAVAAAARETQGTIVPIGGKPIKSTGRKHSRSRSNSSSDEDEASEQKTIACKLPPVFNDQQIAALHRVGLLPHVSLADASMSSTTLLQSAALSGTGALLVPNPKVALALEALAPVVKPQPIVVAAPAAVQSADGTGSDVKSLDSIAAQQHSGDVAMSVS